MGHETQMTNFLMLIEKLVSSNQEILGEVRKGLAAGEVTGFSEQKAENIQRVVADIKELTRLAQELHGHVEGSKKGSR